MGDYIMLFIGLGLFAIGAVLDYLSSIEMTRYGIKETNWLAQKKNGNFDPVKGLIFVILPIVLVLIAFFVEWNDETYDRFWAGFFLLPGAALHYWAFRKNMKKIEAAKGGGN